MPSQEEILNWIKAKNAELPNCLQIAVEVSKVYDATSKDLPLEEMYTVHLNFKNTGTSESLHKKLFVVGSFQALQNSYAQWKIAFDAAHNEMIGSLVARNTL